MGDIIALRPSRRRARLRPLAAIAALCVALGLLAAAQNPGPTETDPFNLAQAVGVGPAAQLPAEGASRDFFNLGLNADSGYETNVTGITGSGGDWLETVAASLEAGQEQGPFRWALSYQPAYTAYRTFSGYDRLDQAGAVQISWRLGPHWFLRLSENAAYGRYLSTPEAAQVPGSVLALNNFVLTPFVRQFSQQPTAELDYVASYRWSFHLLAGYLEHRYFGASAGIGSALSDLDGVTGGAGADYRLSPRTTLGLELDYENAILAGGASRMQLGSALLALKRVLNPVASVTLFAGPQQAELREKLGPFLPAATLASNPGLADVHQNNLSWTAGGTLTVVEHNTAWNLTLSRRGTDSGGLFAGAVEATQALIGVEQRLGLDWTAGATAGYERMALLGVQTANGLSNYSSWTANAHMDRTLGRHWDLHADYDYVQQTEEGQVPGPLAAVLGRQQVSLGIGYRLSLGQGD